MNFFANNKKTNSASAPTVTLPSLSVGPSSRTKSPPREAFSNRRGSSGPAQIDLTVPQAEQPPRSKRDDRFSIGSFEDDTILEDVELAVDRDDQIVVVDTDRLSSILSSRSQAKKRKYLLAALVMVAALAAISGAVLGLAGGSSSGSSTEVGAGVDMTDPVQEVNEPIAISAVTGEDLTPGHFDEAVRFRPPAALDGQYDQSKSLLSENDGDRQRQLGKRPTLRRQAGQRLLGV